MPVQSVTTPAGRTLQPAHADIPVPPKSAPPPRPATLTAPAYAITISAAAKAAAVGHLQTPPPGDATKAARSAVVHAASLGASGSPTTTSGYVMKVRAALDHGGQRSLSQIMASLGIPPAEQQRVAAALGTAPKSA